MKTKKHEFKLTIKTKQSRREAWLKIIALLAGRQPDQCFVTFPLRKPRVSNAPVRSVVLTLRQAELLVRIAQIYHLKPGCGLTPDEQFLVGAARRRVQKTKEVSGRGALVSGRKIRNQRRGTRD